MTVFRIAMCVALAALLGACGGSNVCDEPEPYQQSVEGRRIEAPNGLDPLPVSRELVVPEASPRPPQPEGSPCLELPPVYTSSGK